MLILRHLNQRKLLGSAARGFSQNDQRILNSSDPYEILGVARANTPAEIKEAFRKMAQMYHPDTA
jgi:DnaJ-class molecular chaperone